MKLDASDAIIFVGLASLGAITFWLDEPLAATAAAVLVVLYGFRLGSRRKD